MSDRDATTRHAPAEPRPWATAGAVVAFATTVAVGLDPLLDVVTAAGRHLPPHDIGAGYVKGVLWAIALGASILVWPVPARDRLALLMVWGVKAVVTLVLMLGYEWNYDQLDAYTYFATSLERTPDLSGVGLGSGTENVSALAWLQDQVIPASYHAIKVSYAMCGMIAIYVFYRAAVAAIGRDDMRLFYGLSLFPSILFWSSILGKDPLIVLGIALYAYGVVRWQREQRTGPLAWTALGTVIALAVRLWLAPVLAAPLVVLALAGTRSAAQRVFWVVTGSAALALAVRMFGQRFALATMADLLDTANFWSQGWAEGGSAQLLGSEFTGIGSMVAFVPKGMFTALFRPLPGEVNNAFGLLAGLENAILLGLVATAAARSRLRDLREPLVLGALVFVVVWAGLYGFVSYQNLGTAVRFRLQVLPVFVTMLLYLARSRAGARDAAP